MANQYSTTKLSSNTCSENACTDIVSYDDYFNASDFDPVSYAPSSWQNRIPRRATKRYRDGDEPDASVSFGVSHGVNKSNICFNITTGITSVSVSGKDVDISFVFVPAYGAFRPLPSTENDSSQGDVGGVEKLFTSDGIAFTTTNSKSSLSIHGTRIVLTGSVSKVLNEAMVDMVTFKPSM